MARYMERRRWEIQKILIFAHLILAPIIAGIVLNNRDWINLLPSKVCNCCVDMMGMLILIDLFFIVVKDRNDITYRTGYFIFLISMTSVALFADLMCWSLDGLPQYRVFTWIANEVFFLVGIAMVMVFWRYLLEVAESEDPRLPAMTKILSAGAILTGIAIVGNVFGHYYFYISEDGVFVRGTFYFGSFVYVAVMAVCFILMITRMGISKSKKWSLFSFVTGPVIALGIQLIIHGTSLIYCGVVISLITIYGNVFTQINQELMMQKLDNMDKERQILVAKEEKARLATELSLASEIQTHMIPASFPAFPQYDGFELYASMTPAKEVGGDFYDFFLMDEDHLVLVIADVSGKGIPAALYMMVAKTMIKNVSMQGLSPKEILQKVNHQLCEGSEDVEMFVTVWLGIVEISTGKVVASNAGHEYPILCSKAGTFDIIKDKHGLVLGGMDGARYREYEFTVEPGGTLFVYTDGVPEASDHEKKFFGMENLVRALNIEPHAEPKELIEIVKHEIDEFVDEAEQFDDITMLAFKMEEKQVMAEKKICLAPDMESMNKVQSMIEEMMDEEMVPMKIAMKMNIAIDEIFSNIISYSGAKEAEVGCKIGGGRIELDFVDDGTPYNPLEAKEPDLTLELEEREVGGLGILITKKLMDEIRYEYTDGKNRLYLMKEV